MPAILEDPAAPHVTPPAAQPILQSRTVILKDHVTVATIIPVFPTDSLPLGLVSYLNEEFNNEIDRGDTYPMDTPLTLEAYQHYWFGTFAAVMLLGNSQIIQDGRDWEKDCLGTFYIKPNYPGRSSHVCNGGFFVLPSARGQGVGKLLGEAYLEYAPRLNYTYSVFNLVYESNIASTKIWEGLGFKRIGLIKGAGRLKGHSHPVDAIVFGRELGEDEDYVSEERFDKIRFYLEKGKYPPNSDRSEKSRLRSATTHYRLEGSKLLLKDKEVISDGHQQYEIAKRIHKMNHGGINKTTAMIADKYHWVRIKETVSAVIKNCLECKEHSRAPVVRGDRNSGSPNTVSNTPTSAPIMQHFDLAPMPPPLPLGDVDMDIPVDPNIMDEVHNLTHHHLHHQHHHHQLAPVAQMHAGRLTMVDDPDGTELNLDDHHNTSLNVSVNVNSSAHSAEIARAALTEEEDRQMRVQLVEGLSRIQDPVSDGVGVGVHVNQDMDMDHTHALQ